MNAVRVPRPVLEQIEREARSAYPEEACGFLLSVDAALDGTTRTVERVEPAPNEVREERRRRFVISPDELRRAERRAAERGAVVSGFYHSHPDHPARPSQFDADHAWPWYAYLVTSVDQAGRCETAAFELDAERPQFSSRELLLSAPGLASAVPAAVLLAETPGGRR